MTEEDKFEKFRKALLLQNQEINSLSEKVEKLSVLNSHLLNLIQESGTLPIINDSEDYIATLKLTQENGRPKSSPMRIESSEVRDVLADNKVNNHLLSSPQQEIDHAGSITEIPYSSPHSPDNAKSAGTKSCEPNFTDYHSEECQEAEDDEVFALNGVKKLRRSHSTVAYPAHRIPDSAFITSHVRDRAQSHISSQINNNALINSENKRSYTNWVWSRILRSNLMSEDSSLSERLQTAGNAQYQIEVHPSYCEEAVPSEDEEDNPFHQSSMMTTSLFMKRPTVIDHFDMPQFVDDYAIDETNEALLNSNYFQRRYNSMRNHRQSRQGGGNKDISETLSASFESLRLARNRELKRTNQLTSQSGASTKTYPPSVINGISKLNALVRGYFVRRIMQSDKVQNIIKTIKDTAEFAINIQKDSSRVSTNQDSLLKQRIIAQLRSSLYEIHEIFFECSLDQRLALITYTRQAERHREHEARILERQLEIHGASAYSESNNTPSVPRISAATMKRRLMKDSQVNPLNNKSNSTPATSSKHFTRVQSARYPTTNNKSSLQPASQRKKLPTNNSSLASGVSSLSSASVPQRKRITANLNNKQSDPVSTASTRVMDSLSEDSSDSATRSSCVAQPITISRIPQSSTGPTASISSTNSNKNVFHKPNETRKVKH